MSGNIDDGLASVKDLFTMSESDVSIEEITDEVSSGVGSSAPADDSSVGTRRVICSTPVKRKEVRDTPRKEVRIVAPRSMKCDARFSGGSLDRRAGGFRRLRKNSIESPAGDLEIPVSRTWSNGPRSGRARERFGSASSWDDCPLAQVDVDEALALKGKRNNRAIAEQMVGKCLSLVVNLLCFLGCCCCILLIWLFTATYVKKEDREAERRLGKKSGYFNSKPRTFYGRGVDSRICRECGGVCCNALNDLIGRLVEKGFLIPGAHSPTVSCCCLFS